MSFIAGVLTVVVIINCLLLVLLVLVQLPKKDAGAGLAFGGGAADALFGAGSGNALTKITKWAAGIFFAVALVLNWVENSSTRGSDSSAFEKAASQSQSQPLPVNPSASPGAPATVPSVPPAGTPNPAASQPAVPANPAPTAAVSNGPAK